MRARARTDARRTASLLIFDEVITGFRVVAGGAQQAYGITPDMTTMAKIVAGGLPGGCVAGRAEVLDQIAMGAGTRREAASRIRGRSTPTRCRPPPALACLSIIARWHAPGARRSDGCGSRPAHERRASATGRCRLRARIFVDAAHRDRHGRTAAGRLLAGMGRRRLSAGARAAAKRAMRLLAMLNEGVHLMGDGMMVSSAHTPEDVDDTARRFRARCAR